MNKTLGYLSVHFQCFIHDGKTGKPIGELNEPAGRIHKAGIYGVSNSGCVCLFYLQIHCLFTVTVYFSQYVTPLRKIKGSG